MWNGIRISYIVSVYNDLSKLPCCLWSLMAQTDDDFEILVTGNSKLESDHVYFETLIEQIAFNAPNIRYIRTEAISCYHSAEMGAAQAQGEFLCFPSDDSYYMPEFGELMYAAAQKWNADLVLCDMIYNNRFFSQEPRTNFIDKTGFILKRDKFTEFPNKSDRDIPQACDGWMIDALMATGIAHAKIPDVLGVHN